MTMLVLTEDQEMLAESVAQVVATEAPVARFRQMRDEGLTRDDPLWQQFIELGWPGREATITSLATGAGLAADDIASVAMLGIEGPLTWRQDYQGLHITMPDRRPCDHAYTFKVSIKPGAGGSAVTP